MHGIQLTKEKKDLEACFPLFKELYPNLVEKDFANQLKKQIKQGYNLAVLKDQQKIKTVAGYRIFDTLHWGKILFLDDLVTFSEYRSQGFGGVMLKWLEETAYSAGCKEIHISSSFHRHEAHAVYLRYGYKLVSHYLTLSLPSKEA